jgi:hypothetical protein
MSVPGPIGGIVRHPSLFVVGLIVLASAASACKPSTKPPPEEEEECEEDPANPMVFCDGWQPYDPEEDEDAGI